MPYNSVAGRVTPGTGPLIPEDVQKEIAQSIEVKSAAMQLMPHVTMKRAQQRIPVMTQLPIAYWLTGASLDARDRGLKQTTSLAWDNVYLNAEEMAVIVPIAKSLLDDIDYDFWSQVKPKITEAFGVALDEAIFFGNGAPSTFPPAIVTAAGAAGNLLVVGATAGQDYLGDVNAAMGLVEADGYDVSGFWARKQVKAKMRGMRTTTGAFIMLGDDNGPQAAVNTGSLYGEPIVFSNAGLVEFGTGATGYSMIGGQWDQSMLAIREDISMEMFDTGVITDNTSAIIFNLLQQDMVALRVIARFAWAVPNPVNRQQQTVAARYPFFALQQKATTGGET
jgi:HK97 family phage major capsid protein